MEIVNHDATSATVISADDIPPSSFEFVMLDLTGLSVEEAFVLGMAHDLYNNRGIPVPLPAQTHTFADLETEVI